jgi:signal transduction histidine kinase
MYSGKTNSGGASAAWRIAIWPTVALAVGSAVAFSIMYLLIAGDIRARSDGPGFSPALRDQAFERFVKGKNSTGRDLGLAFVNVVVQAHGGHVDIADRVGGGAAISLALPMAETASAKVAARPVR